MYTYDKPFRDILHFAAVDFGTGSDILRVIAVPRLDNGRHPGGRVVGARVHNITEDFAGSTKDAAVHVGDGVDADKYFASQALDESVDMGDSVWLYDQGAGVDIENGRSSVTVTFVSATGTPTGIADVTLIIDWF